MKSTILGHLAFLAAIVTASPIRRQDNNTYYIPSSLQEIIDGTKNNPAYQYPTDLTQGIIPKAIHSHNDYWRTAPFYTALSVGAISIEADVWYTNDSKTLYIGHDELSLQPARTFDALYIQPILNVLDRQNPTGQILTSATKYGVFDTVNDQTLYLFVDVKTNGEEAWPVIVEALQPLREKGYLTRYDGSTVIKGAVTVIGTGNTPLDQIQGVSQRDYFFDANLALLNSTQANITSAISPIASTQFSRYIGSINGTQFSQTQLATLSDQLAVAKQRGIGARYWDTPAWPISTRDAVWRTLVNEGVALLNADGVVAAAGFGGPAAW